MHFARGAGVISLTSRESRMARTIGGQLGGGKQIAYKWSGSHHRRFAKWWLHFWYIGVGEIRAATAVHSLRAVQIVAGGTVAGGKATRAGWKPPTRAGRKSPKAGAGA